MNNDNPQMVLDFWFEGVTQTEIPQHRIDLWFGKSDATDTLLKERFENLVERAADGSLKSWDESPQGRLALVVLLDQFPRNIYRGTPRAFSHDPLARLLVLTGLDHRMDEDLNSAEKLFFYLPLEHTEDKLIQYRSVQCFDHLRKVAPPQLAKMTELFYDYAVKHQVVIDRFGRFPHRNVILGRESTPEEIEFLKQPGSSF
ncbi:MAG: DUF924 domain-containing protein [Myxococcales bacterium]|nr:DUF924 domain-containing protein [Myxococcales bacterium]